MTDDRFYQRAGPFTLGEIAACTGAEVQKVVDRLYQTPKDVVERAKNAIR